MTQSKLKSGNSYTLEDLFSENIKIIIPDLQRDYCWGDAQHGKKKQELVSDFLKSLVDGFKNAPTEPLQLGMIYAYENPTNHIQLCDGQQRITTLYLLMGMLRRAVRTPELKKQLKERLISNFEWDEDDKECRLQYAIRDSTLYFLNDLVAHFFISDTDNVLNNVLNIENQTWFFNEYSLDPSIQSILNALKIIEKELAGKNWNQDNFAKYLMEQVKVLYFDVEDRQRGEDIFVIINTTGEPLTPSEQLKPILLGDLDNSELNNKWEERETYFWQNRKLGEVEADDGVKHFLEWFLKIRKQTETVHLMTDFKAIEQKKDTLAVIHQYFLKIPTLIKVLQNPVVNNDKTITSEEKIADIQRLRSLTIEIQNNILLPLFAYIVKFDEAGADAFLRRLRKNYYDTKRSERKSNYIDWRYILKIIEKSEDLETILTFDSSSLDKIQNVELKVWYNEEEQWKKQLKINHKVLIESWEDNDDFMGDLTPLKKISDSSKDIKQIKHYYKTYYFIKNLEGDYTNNELRNRYFLNSIYKSPSWYHGSIGGYGYHSLSLDEKLLHLQNGFYEVWRTFDEHYNLEMEKLNENAVMNFLKEQNKSKLREISQAITGQEDASKIREIDTKTTLTLYNKTLELWLYLEMLHQIDQRINFKRHHKIANFWDWKKNLNFTNDEHSKAEKFPIGNWTCGACFKGKRDDFDYQCYELMKRANEQYKKHHKDTLIEEQLKLIQENTKFYNQLIINELNS